MSQVTMTVFDPALCCSTGVCGPSVDEKLVRFAADLSWLESQGVAVQRFNLAQQPAAFAEDAEAKATLEGSGVEGLPLIKVDGAIKSSGVYPSREELAEWAQVSGSVATPPSSGGCCGPSPAAEALPAPVSSGQKDSGTTGCC